MTDFGRWKQQLAEYAPPLSLLLAWLLIWEGVVIWRDVPEWILPAPSQMVLAIWETYPILLPHIWQTLKEMTLGLLLSLVTGILLAAALDLSPWLRRAIYPLLIASQTIPILALAPLLIIWFGFGILPKILVVTLFCFFPIAINTTDGLSATDPEHLSLLRAMGATRRQLWLKVRLPSALPYFFSGLRIAATYSVVGAIIGEWVGASEGLGIYMLRSANAFRTSQVFAAILISSLLSLSLFGIVYLIERIALPWYHTAERHDGWRESKEYNEFQK